MKPPFVENQIYHIYNRGVEKRNIFLNDKDHFRFIHDLFELNNEQKDSNIGHYFKDNQNTKVEPSYFERKPRKLLVEILVFTLMPNHFHLLLKQKREKGIVRFMQKLGTGYTMYFNKRHNRVGGLFQGRFKAVLVEKEPHFLYLPHYIHLNPLELLNYEGSTFVNWKRKMEFLEKYRWSSLLDYIGEKNFPSVISREFLLNNFGSEEKYRKELEDRLRGNYKDFSNIKEVILE